ncbi:hypothetical protein RSK20926_06087 [Roseobacter sp. SK209-2-6]|uniref:DUF2478 domain-containing protein n=1 Tax=Roseobacter sp. SK209-2-6 TaxID=388739 RepID=UPI0000F3D7A4|nr:DUF2478 domain-containing protein [Roseobacter sp. SK209-2-6]EBA17282.1 hypothetical protein RSK20926_06087 [Roseobacter sp. SK209-2-6]
MKIASLSSEKRGETDRLLSQLAGNLQAEGHQLAGIVKDESYEGTAANGCDMRVRVLSSGNIIQITQNLGAGSDACRLDPSAITEAVRQVEAEPLDGVELFVLNKFGPEECAGRGFCAVIGQAIETGIPVLVGVGLASREKFEAFAGGLAEALPDEETALKAWCQEAMY